MTREVSSEAVVGDVGTVDRFMDRLAEQATELDGMLGSLSGILAEIGGIKDAIVSVDHRQARVVGYLRQTADRMRYIARKERGVRKRDLVLGIRRLTELADRLERE
jgi:hypothetical protein